MSKLGDQRSLLTACPSSPPSPSLLLRRSPECSALDTLDCISINSTVKGSAYLTGKVYHAPFCLSSSPLPVVEIVGGYVRGISWKSMLRFFHDEIRLSLFYHFATIGRLIDETFSDFISRTFI